MEDLPPPLIVDILSRLTDSTDLARCRVASKALNSLARDVRSVDLLCTASYYIKSRSPNNTRRLKPFKTVFLDLVRDCSRLESVSVAVDQSLREAIYDDEDEYDDSDDLYLSDAGFVNQWLPRLSCNLRKLSISDFWSHSCWRRSEVLGLISSCCQGLQELELKNAWLSVDGLSLMPSLTSLALEYVRLDDENLDRVNTCCPCLQTLNLIGVGGLKEPKIDLLHLQSLHWTVSNVPLSFTIIALNLVKLRLECFRPESLVLETPLLSDFHLTIYKVNEFVAKDLSNLRNLRLESSDLYSLLSVFPSDTPIEKLNIDSKSYGKQVENHKFCIEDLLDMFPNINSLTLGRGAWSEAQAFFCSQGLGGTTEFKELKEIVAHWTTLDSEIVTHKFIHSLLDRCRNLLSMTLLIPSWGDPRDVISLISMCRNDHPEVRWKWTYKGLHPK